MADGAAQGLSGGQWGAGRRRPSADKSQHIRRKANQPQNCAPTNDINRVSRSSPANAIQMQTAESAISDSVQTM